MREQFQRAPASVDWTVANPGDTGEAIQAMARAGGGLALMDESWWGMVFMPPGGGEPRQTVPELHKPFGLMVDASGQRFVNEANSYMEVGRACYLRNQEGVKAIPAWLVMDARARKRYIFAFQFPGPWPNKWIEAGAIKRDMTIAGLARQCGIDPDGLERTIARFNTFAQRGVDEDFHKGDSAYNRYYGDPTVKPNPCLGAVEKPPFWAAPLYPGDVGTCGGAMTNEHGQVIREDGTPVDGLYAAGNCTASLAGPYYIGAGQSIGTSSIFGYLAAKHAAG
jgi:3-oxosteroid 1-dehydrogenase